jgi:UDP-glucose 4-epimerase
MAFVAERVVVVGGAGFVGSHFVDHFLAAPTTQWVTIFDNFTSGRRWHYQHHQHDPRLHVVHGDVKDLPALGDAVAGSELVVHLASNPDIARAMVEPTVDFDEGTLLTNNVIEACRRGDVSRVMYASGSGVYGELGELEVAEDHGPLEPVSTYGASKLAGEALLASYCHLFGMSAASFRFGNVVGPRQTHGVGFDFLKSLRKDPTKLRILGDGSQSKSYVHISDIVRAVVTVAALDDLEYDVFNVATGDYATVTEIAEIALSVVGLRPDEVRLEYTGGDRGWKGDVPVVRLNTEKVQRLGWRRDYSSHEALRAAMVSMLGELDAGLL